MTSRPARTLDAAALVLDFCDVVVLRSAHEAHMSVSKRLFAPVRAIGGRLPEAFHDVLVDTAYATGSGALRVAGDSLRALSARGLGPELEGNLPGRHLVVAVNGLAGPHLSKIDDPHAISMSVRIGQLDLPLSKFHLRKAFPAATGHLVVLVHGLLESDESWASGDVDHVEAIAERTSGTPVVIRYNTGLSPAHNGRQLDLLVTSLVNMWPTRPTRITFVGHSMGGLVIRAAANTALAQRRGWVPLLRDVVLLGGPQMGSVREKAGALGARRGRPKSVTVRTGSAGLKGWQGEDVTQRWGNGRRAAAPLGGVDYWYAITEPEHVVLATSRVRDLVVHWIEQRDGAPRSISG